ncbi:FAD:protein FMN transferase [Ostreiculturibacter nitratireducens]|uniref:FAD:protein FMN transferase n=1 Tax=Ostreiculturibacter nitratireducens TaxID=3075226 RepID=UPI0031B5F50D
MLTRRRFLAISAAAVGMAPVARAETLHVWQGTALGARATIRLAHPEAQAITARAMAEIDRLENVFSLYREGSALSRLNAEGRLAAPPFELLECLSLAGRVHEATGGLFDATVQPLWALHAEAAVEGRAPSEDEVAGTMARTGWRGVGLDSGAITLRPGMAITLNGIAQGYIADRVAALLSGEGLTDVLIDTGELRALGGQPRGGDWPVQLAGGGSLGLRGRALATSAPLGTVFDREGRLGHILDPRIGRPVAPRWQSVSVSAPSAAVADALSTAACLAEDRNRLSEMISFFQSARLEAAVEV